MADNPNLPPEIADALAKGKVIEAIKLARQQKNVGLAEAKAMIDALQRQANVRVNVRTRAAAPPKPAAPAGIEQHPGLSPGEVPRAPGGAILAACVLLALLALGAALFYAVF